MECPNCSKPLIWGGDHDYESYGLEGEGAVSNLICNEDNCPVDVVIVYYNYNDNEEERTTQEFN